LSRVELGLLAAQTTLRPGDSHALLGPQTDQVGLELGDHRQHVEQQPTDGVGRIVHRRADAQLDLTPRQVLEDLAGIRHRSCQSVEFGHDERVAGATRRQRLTQAGPVAIAPVSP